MATQYENIPYLVYKLYDNTQRGVLEWEVFERGNRFSTSLGGFTVSVGRAYDPEKDIDGYYLEVEEVVTEKPHSVAEVIASSSFTKTLRDAVSQTNILRGASPLDRPLVTLLRVYDEEDWGRREGDPTISELWRLVRSKALKVDQKIAELVAALS